MITATVKNDIGQRIRVKVHYVRQVYSSLKVAEVEALAGTPFLEYSYQGGPVPVSKVAKAVSSLEDIQVEPDNN